MIHNANCSTGVRSNVLIDTDVGVTHNAECYIDGRIMPDEKVYYDAGITLADLNRIFPNWEHKMPLFVRARWPKEPVIAAQVIRQAIITGMMYAVEEIMRSKI